ncbi:alpha/beta hydrolase [Amycolatopsis jiangsuensis]|uniref:Pimeloyl-ACP methyl ester carboxylesterase n=1 Tax=Amycolatopsis jiangsuensis TaxID=1181879 RepID=A0A840IMR3_9PSEU|nr:alpha/beta hydrolase [Amycolatopsis jiangsuensis]MBB4682859.1 pimeloyl-ACP methyl ester carboxylesterase [Amycolatopsis jiangsuensis]
MTVRAARLAGVAGVAVTVLGLTTVPAAAAADSGITFAECAPELGAPRGTGCAQLAVPLDYTDAAGKQITLTLAAAGSLDAPDVLVVNPGGPGESGIGTPQQVVASMSPELRDKYLVVSFDPRGVGASSPVDCGDTSGLVPTPMPPNEPADADQEQQRVGIARSIADACAQHSGDLLPHITTQNTARDMDRIRTALGKDKLDYLGYSYGTELGATYATMFPATSGKMVLDSVVDPTASGYESGFEQDPALQHRAGQFFEWAAKQDATYHLGTTGDAVAGTWNDLRGKLGAEPLENKVGSAELDNMLASTMYIDASWPTLARAVTDYRAGETSALTSAAGQLALSAVNGPQLAYNCADDEWPADWRKWHADTTRAATESPLFAWLNTWYSAPCAFWKAPTAPPLEIGSGDVPPVLLVQAKDDSATPFPGAQRMQRAFEGSRMVLSDGGNHGQFLFDQNDCVDKPVTQYLLTGQLPAADVKCAAPPAPGE